jgi:fimbrial chaperone protein
MRPTTVIAALLGLCAGFGCATSQAQGLQVAPISVQFEPGQRSTTLTIANQNSVPVSVQLRAFMWDQNSPDDALTPTNDLAVSPPITEVGAGQTQLFRLLLRRPATGKEASYRLLFDQLPNTGDTTTPGIKVLLRLSVPVFVEPANPVTRNIAWRVTAGPHPTLVGTNRGSGHIRLVNPAITRPDGQKLALQPERTPYILPGAERSWTIHDGSQLRPGSKVHLTAISDLGPVDALVDVAPP